jgi:NAD-dependent SIR2 family protein deacetylase
MKERRCAECGAALTDEDVMKIKIDDGSWETIPLPVCPACFKKQMHKLADVKREKNEKP